MAVADLPAASADQLLEADAVVLGAPAGESLSGPARAFLDTAAAAWSAGALAGKAGAAFAPSETDGVSAGGAVVATMQAALLHSGAAVVSATEHGDAGMPFVIVSVVLHSDLFTVAGSEGGVPPRALGSAVADTARRLVRGK